jgi:hypothetical protein
MNSHIITMLSHSSVSSMNFNDKFLITGCDILTSKLGSNQRLPFPIVFLLFRFLEDVLESTCALLCIHPTMGSQLPITPVHLLALVDIRAHWLTTWLVSTVVTRQFSTLIHHDLSIIQHGSYSRAPFLKILHQNRSIVSTL